MSGDKGERKDVQERADNSALVTLAQATAQELTRRLDEIERLARLAALSQRARAVRSKGGQ